MKKDNADKARGPGNGQGNQGISMMGFSWEILFGSPMWENQGSPHGSPMGIPQAISQRKDDTFTSW